MAAGKERLTLATDAVHKMLDCSQVLYYSESNNVRSTCPSSDLSSEDIFDLIRKSR